MTKINFANYQGDPEEIAEILETEFEEELDSEYIENVKAREYRRLSRNAQRKD